MLKKFYIFLFMFAAFIFSFFITEKNVNAADTDIHTITVNDYLTYYTIPNTCIDEYVIFSIPSGEYRTDFYLACPTYDSDFRFMLTDRSRFNNYLYYFLDLNDKSKVPTPRFYLYCITRDNISYSNSTLDFANVSPRNETSFELSNNVTFYFSTNDVLYYTTYGDAGNDDENFSNAEIFFQPTPLVKTTVLAEAVEELPAVILQVVRVVLPICLIILSAVLVISLTRSVIYRHL